MQILVIGKDEHHIGSISGHASFQWHLLMTRQSMNDSTEA